MILIERHIITRDSNEFKPLDELCRLSKNLYNSALYAVRQHYFETKTYKNKFELINEFTKNGQVDYVSLPRKVSQKVVYQVDNNFKSFFESRKSEKVRHKVKIPKYLKKDGRNVVVFTNQAISSKRLKEGFLQLSGLKSFELKVQHTDVKEVKVVHKGHSIEVLIAYEKNEKPLKEKKGRICSIDLGLNNLMTIGSNILIPFILNGKPLKSINHFYNKRLSQLKSTQKKKDFNSRKIETLTLKRNNKVNDYLHKSSRMLVNYLVFNNIDQQHRHTCCGS